MGARDEYLKTCLECDTTLDVLHEVAQRVEILGSGLHTYAMCKDYSTDDAFLHHGKESSLEKRERKQISDSINVHFKSIRSRNLSRLRTIMRVLAAMVLPHSPAQGWKTMFRT